MYFCYIWTPRASDPRVIGILMGISTPMKLSILVQQNQQSFDPISLRYPFLIPLLQLASKSSVFL
jgi:hypothetical protein